MTLDALIGVAGRFDQQDLVKVFEALVDGNDFAYATRYEDGIVVYPAAPYCDEESAPEGWLNTKHALETLMEMFPNNFVYYAADNFFGGEDQILYNPNRQPITEERIAKIDKTYEEGQK